MAQLRDTIIDGVLKFSDGTIEMRTDNAIVYEDTTEVSELAPIPVIAGGTGAITAAGARANLELSGATTETLLWENASLSTFNAQTISLDLSEYDYVRITSCYSSGGEVASELTFKIGEIGYSNFVILYSISPYRIYSTRAISVKTTGISIGDNEHYQSTYETKINYKNVPLRIVGIKVVE